ncbi:phosphorylase b kinase gamma catalytic chain, skeletal muscle/heart isoform-like isoform X2 [Scyliorhinus torazame]|uniref:phosphorylase b kinase gamma catalytic chain, skeletal muscle/heart isoform-like isoform X2 n=1 Tax=Scyliorhinus torazame TaxID=75743 RepID=UPI003B5A5DF0
METGLFIPRSLSEETMTRDVHLGDTVAASGFYQKYNPKDVIGRGVSSVVQRCVHKVTGMEYAVKIIEVTAEGMSPDQLDEVRRSTQKEIEILKVVSGHPSIITLIDFFTSETVTFLVFDLMKRGELFDYLTHKVVLSEKETRNVMRELLEAIHYLHKLNIVHRDIKTENILLDDQVHVRLSDFGFACHLRHDEKLRDLCGTPGYLAPELLICSMDENHAGYGKEVDMWSAGVVMYTLLAGSPPFWHRKQMVMLRFIMEGNYQLTSNEWEDRSDTVKELISRMLTVDPSKRITAEEALSHPFFQSYTPEVRHFSPLRKFRVAVWAARVCIRVYDNYRRVKLVTKEALIKDPYAMKAVRRLIDGCAFGIYGHWVKKGLTQNRAALFENSPKALIHLPTFLDEEEDQDMIQIYSD